MQEGSCSNSGGKWLIILPLQYVVTQYWHLSLMYYGANDFYKQDPFSHQCVWFLQKSISKGASGFLLAAAVPQMLKEAFWHSSSWRDPHFQHAEVQEKTWESRVWDHIAMWDIGQKTDVHLQETGFHGALAKSAWGKEHRKLGATEKRIGNNLIVVLNCLQSEKRRHQSGL